MKFILILYKINNRGAPTFYEIHMKLMSQFPYELHMTFFLYKIYILISTREGACEMG